MDLNGKTPEKVLPPRTGPELAAMRLDSMEQRIAQLERRMQHLERLVPTHINAPQEPQLDA